MIVKGPLQFKVPNLHTQLRHMHCLQHYIFTTKGQHGDQLLRAEPSLHHQCELCFCLQVTS